MNQNVRVVSAPNDEKFVFDTCCCCIPLRTGCLILGYLQLIAHIIGGIFAVLAIGTGLALLNAEDERYKTAAQAVIIIGAVGLVIILVALPFTILLLCGLHKERRNFVKYYLVFAVVCLVLGIIVQIAKYSGGYGDSKELPSIIINIVLTIYFLLVLRSQYIKMGYDNNVPVQHYNPDAQLMNVQKV
ncbi:uncharacterized protein LOC112054403 [Bicyclus anynana]|uniref:Uncharacterized protein LOC112054403 n=1 Tax=Bicyclus anynana TaxID=110368 RepID=A0A6J1NT77_BICAN|nr:uncharacterized protein LOC112054403 [Bicyclus anynana]